jgi:hydroxyacylglutathione hydrolase
MTRIFAVFLMIASLAGGGANGWAAADEIQDAESATHAGEAAEYQLIETYEFSGFRILQFDLSVLSHYSYMLISGDECLVVDPGRDIATYVERAKQEQARITGVWLTHSHADFVAGHIEFAETLDVPLRISGEAKAGYEHIALQDGDSLTVGQAVLKFLATPGHTPDSMCGLVANSQEPDNPLAMLSGDTLFIGSVGRPDLLGEGLAASTLASMMFDTWTNKLSKLPDQVRVLPAHGAGSLCGADLSDEPSSTLGEQRVENRYLQYTNRGEFIAAILEGLPDAPQYFAHNAALNRSGPPRVDWQPEELDEVAPSEALTDPAKYYVVDVREADAYFAGHIPNAVNIGLRGRFELWTGTMVPWDAKLILTGSSEELREAVKRLHRVGYQAQALPIDKWQAAGLPLKEGLRIKPTELHAAMQKPESPIVVDVRLPAEWMALRIGTVVNIPLNQLPTTRGKLDPSQPLVAVCNSAYRSSLAAGLLTRRGFQQAASLEGGAEAWIAAGLPVFEASEPYAAAPLVGATPSGATPSGATPSGATRAGATRPVRLAERISAADLRRRILDLPGTFQLVDIRPPEQFADYRLPAAENVAIADLLDNPAYASGDGPLIVVCRDGTISMMVAGILAQKSERNIKALYGGVDAYWAASVGQLMSGGEGPATKPAAAAPATPPAAAPTPRAPAAAAPAAPVAPARSRKAGC